MPSYRWQTYFVSADVDASTLRFANGPLPVSGAFVSPLYDSDGENSVVDRNPSATPVGLISGIPTFSFAALVGFVPAGQYKVGFACTLAGAVEHGRYWETPITITDVSPTSFTYSVGGAAPALQIGSPVPDEGLVAAERCSSTVVAAPPCGSR